MENIELLKDEKRASLLIEKQSAITYLLVVLETLALKDWNRIELYLVLIFSTIYSGWKNRSIEICISMPFSALVGLTGQISNFFFEDLRKTAF